MTPATKSDAQLRTEILSDFSLACGLPALERVVQHGEDPTTVRYTFHFEGGREVRVPSAAVLFSQAQLNQLFAVVLRRTMIGCKPVEWRERVNMLVENGLAEAFRPLVVVAADEATQIARARARDAASEDDVRARIAAQMPLAKKLAQADFVIDNDGDLALLIARSDQTLDDVARRCDVDPARYPR